MTKIKSFNELQKLKSTYISEKSDEAVSKEMVLIKVGMATCGIASGAKQIFRFLEQECEQQAIDVKIKKTGCLGYCYAEPMIEVFVPGKKPKVFGFVDKPKAREIIEKYILRGEPVDGEIALAFTSV